jgi:hypothetical protein
MRPCAAVPLAAILLTACASGSGGTARAHGGRGDPNVITAEEIGRAPAQNLYDAVRALRPAWMMRSRPTALRPENESELIVYLDGRRFGNLESLRQIAPNAVTAVRYYSPSSAEARFGAGHLQGAIEVTTTSR